MLTGNAFLPGRRCSAHVMMQRVVADKLLGDAVLDGIGLTARMLIVEPPASTVGDRPFWEALPKALRFSGPTPRQTPALLTRYSLIPPDTQDVLDPPIMTFTPDARALWVRFHDVVESDLRRGGELHSIGAFGAKMGDTLAGCSWRPDRPARS